MTLLLLPYCSVIVSWDQGVASHDSPDHFGPYQSPNHQYSKSGRYNVKVWYCHDLRPYDDYCCSFMSRDIYVS